jgi:nuclear pore complex protein Nup107
LQIFGAEPTDDTISSDDEFKIKAIEWLCFDPSQRLDAIIQANGLLREFIGIYSFSILVNELYIAFHRLQAARQLIKILPEDSIEVVVQHYPSSEIANDFIAEYESLCFYIYAQENYILWHSHRLQKPIEPQAIQ